MLQFSLSQLPVCLYHLSIFQLPLDSKVGSNELPAKSCSKHFGVCVLCLILKLRCLFSSATTSLCSDYYSSMKNSP